MSKLRLAFIGCGNIMHKHARHAAGEPVEVVALADPQQAGIDRMLDSHEHIRNANPLVTDDPSKVYRANPDAVVIASPHTMHYDQAVEALDHGCHVLLEKPMVTDLGHANALASKVNQTGKQLCIAYNSPCTAELYTLREHVRKQTWGKLKAVSINLTQMWYRATQGKWRQDPALSGGGQWYDSGAHPLCSLVWVVESDIDEVYAHLDNLDTPVDINGTATIRFANGVLASVAICGEGAMGSHGAWVFEKARVEVDPWHANHFHARVKGDDGGESVVKYPQMLGKDGQPLNNFIDAILGRDEPRTTVLTGVHQSQLMDAVYRSAKSGRPQSPNAG